MTSRADSTPAGTLQPAAPVESSTDAVLSIRGLRGGPLANVDLTLRKGEVLVNRITRPGAHRAKKCRGWVGGAGGVRAFILWGFAELWPKSST